MGSFRIVGPLDSDKATFTQWHGFILSFVKEVFCVLGISHKRGKHLCPCGVYAPLSRDL